MATTQETIDRLRRPEYTGENRCLPCTVTNLVIAGIASAALSVLWLPVGATFFVAALGAIWLRGYLVPGTPELTKRYFPTWLLSAFGKAPAVPDRDIPDDVDPESVLLEAGVVEPCADVDDLCLVDDFREAWHERMNDLRQSGTDRAALARELDLEADGVTFENHDGAFLARHDGQRIGQWESRAALRADLAAARELSDRIDVWNAYPAPARSAVLGGLRAFVERCPDCGGSVALGREVVRSCCHSQEVVEANCTECDARLLEVPLEE